MRLLPRFLDAAGLRKSMQRKARTKRQSSSSSSSSSSSGGDPIVVGPLPDDTPDSSSSRPPAADTPTPAAVSPETSSDTKALPTQTRTPLPPPVNMPTDQDSSESTPRAPETSSSSSTTASNDDDDNDTASSTDSRSSTSPFIASTSPLPSQPSLPTPATRPSSDTTDTDTDEDQATRTVRPGMAPSSKTRTERPTSSSALSKGSKGVDGHKPDSTDNDVKKTPATTYVAIAFGCLGGLLLIMALSAYYRRWRRKRRLSKQLPDDEFVSKSEDPPQSGLVPPSPTLTASSYMTEDKSNAGPSDWKNTDLPDVPPLPAAYQPRRESRSRTSSGATDPAIPPDMQEFAGHLRPQTISTTIRSSSAPISIETRGHTRTFSRPASELVLGGSTIGSSHSGGGSTVLSGEEPSSPSKIYPHRHPSARHNSYASNKYESLRPPSQRASMPNGPERFS